MYQYDDPTCAATLPAPAAPGTAGYFTDGNPGGGIAATALRSDFMNMVMMELLNVVEAGGETPSKTTYNQVLTAIKTLLQISASNYAVDTSATANTISLALTPALTTYTDGQKITFKAANNNTGPCTINAGDGSVNLVGAAGALQGGEIIAGNQYTALYSASLGEFVLISQTAGALQVNAATQNDHAVNLGQFNSSVAQNGYQRLPNGLIIQWGIILTNSSGIGTLTFPIAFPKNCFSIVANPASANPVNVITGTSNLTRTTVNIYCSTQAGTASSNNNQWIAIGN